MLSLDRIDGDTILTRGTTDEYRSVYEEMNLKVDHPDKENDLHMSQRLRSATKPDMRALSDLESVGPATLSDLEELGITEVLHLLDKDARDLFTSLQKLKGRRLDPCCQD
ncbi:MAG: hypothetical protein IH914_09365, partial [candidate division Zixibacteria bacterium]|nr:hypothetical protein [candidate division Zixibacteria bacterium]